MKKLLCLLFAAAMILAAPVAMASDDTETETETDTDASADAGTDADKDKKKDDSPAAQRAEIDEVAAETLEELFEENEKAWELYEEAAGYAVFDNTRVTFIFTGGGGAGVAVNKETGKRVYMKMGTGGIALGIGAQTYQVIFLFETEKILENFIKKGWKAESSANAAAGNAGANVGTNFIDGIATFQVTEAGLMASADISGTKYKVAKKLND